MWAWGALIVGGYLLYSWYKNRSSSATSGTATIATGLGAAGGYGSYGGAFGGGGGGGGGGGSTGSGGSTGGTSGSTGGTGGSTGSTPGSTGSSTPGSGGNSSPYPGFAGLPNYPGVTQISTSPPMYKVPTSELLSTNWTTFGNLAGDVNTAALAGESGAPSYVPFFQPQGSTGPPISQAGVAGGPVTGSNVTGSILGSQPGFYQGPGSPGWAVPTLENGGTVTTYTNGVPTG